jgi:hypothetical protein
MRDAVPHLACTNDTDFLDVHFSPLTA